jgi:hypothetical protein
MLKASTSRLVYCIGLFALTACAVLPAPVPETTMAVSTSAPLSVEVRLAQTIRERIELQSAPVSADTALAERPYRVQSSILRNVRAENRRKKAVVLF